MIEIDDEGPDEQPSTHVLEQPPAKKACRPLMSGQRDDGGGGGGGGGEQEPGSRLEGHHVLITGRFDGKSRADIEKLVLSLGGKVQQQGPNGTHSPGSYLVSVSLSLTRLVSAFSALTRLGLGLLELNRVQVDLVAVFSTLVENKVVYSDLGLRTQHVSDDALFVTGKTTVLVLGTDPGWKKIVEFRRLLSEGRRFIKVTQQELESHSTQVTQDLLLTFDDIVPRQGISFV